MLNTDSTWIEDYLNDDIKAGYISEAEARKRLAYWKATSNIAFHQGYSTERGKLSIYKTEEYNAFSPAKKS